jgi:hypothetical protein
MLTAKWKATDDYGVAGITSDIYLADEQDEGMGFRHAASSNMIRPSFPMA